MTLQELQAKNKILEGFIEEFLSITLIHNTENGYRGKQNLDALALMDLFYKIVDYRDQQSGN